VVKATTVAVAIIRLTATARIVLLTQCLLKTIFGVFVGIPFAIISKAGLFGPVEIVAMNHFTV
jgi:hypothetical protein